MGRMGQSGMSEFAIDDRWQKGIRERILKPFYKKNAHEERFIFVDKGKLADVLQKEFAVDTILQKSDNRVLAIEEKIIRWPGYTYTAFTLEIMSCTVPGRERQGWMYTAKCDLLLYCFIQENSNDAIIYVIPFVELQNWFFENGRFCQYTSTITKQINHTECKVVPIADVLIGVPSTKKIVLNNAPASRTGTTEYQGMRASARR
jgi:hypothetical protein